MATKTKNTGSKKVNFDIAKIVRLYEEDVNVRQIAIKIFGKPDVGQNRVRAALIAKGIYKPASK